MGNKQKKFNGTSHYNNTVASYLRQIYRVTPRSPQTTGDLSLTGFTLIEIMVTVVIISISLLAIITAFSHLFNGLKSTENYNQAVIISLEQFNQVEDEILRLGETADVSKYSGVLEDGTRRFNWEFTEELIPDYPNLREIQLTINWADGRRTGTINWKTYLSNE